MAESITDAEHRRLLSELITHLTACLRATNIAREAQHLVVRATLYGYPGVDNESLLAEPFGYLQRILSPNYVYP